MLWFGSRFSYRFSISVRFALLKSKCGCVVSVKGIPFWITTCERKILIASPVDRPNFEKTFSALVFLLASTLALNISVLTMTPICYKCASKARLILSCFRGFIRLQTGQKQASENSFLCQTAPNCPSSTCYQYFPLIPITVFYLLKNN